MTGDGKGIGTKFGISFTGKWVWNMKDYIDVGFMKLFDPNLLFNDFKNKKFAEPLEFNELFEEEKAGIASIVGKIREGVNKMDPLEAAKQLKCSEEETEFQERLQIIDRMGKEADFAEMVVKEFRNLP